MAVRVIDPKFLERWLDEDDDPLLWHAIWEYVVVTWEPRQGDLLEVGRCSHWLRPHQTRWKADGGFAWPSGYGEGASSSSRQGVPEFDWSVRATWDGTHWVLPRSFKELAGSSPELRLAIPSRTARHNQAAVHSLWRIEKDLKVEFYGFRRKPEGWSCTADSGLAVDRQAGRKSRRARDRNGTSKL